MTMNDQWAHVEVLRLGHRPERDKRITTHVALVARAFGASSIHIDTKDPSLERNIESVTDRFGGDFRIETGVPRKRVMGRWAGTIVHLTMYGAPLDDTIREIPEGEDVLVIVGAEKVPADVYDLAHFNIAVANQPHSEVSALALFLDRLFKGKEIKRTLGGGEVKIHPTNVGKIVADHNDITFEQIIDPFEMDIDPVPSKEDCLGLLLALGISRPVLTHLKEVHRLGMEMVKASRKTGTLPDLDLGLLEAGLLLHDIGRARTHSIRHVTLGAELASKLGLDERIVSIIHNHIGEGITKGEASDIGLPAEDHIPLTLEEMIVCHADNLVGDHKRRPLSAALERLRIKGANAAVVRMEALHEELETLLGIDIDELIG